MNKLKFSIVISTYNRPSLLTRCINSMVAAKDHFLGDVIVIDDCSSIDYSCVLSKFPWITYKKMSTNSGPSVARNAGIKLAKNNWVIIFDDDDEMLPDAFLIIKKHLLSLENASHFPVVQFAISNLKIHSSLLVRNLCMQKLEYYLEDKIHGDVISVINKRRFIDDGFFYPNVKIGAESILWFSILKKYSTPLYTDVICNVGADADVRLTDVDNQIKRAKEYAEIQKIMLEKFSDVYNKYPAKRLERQLGYVVYNILSGNAKHGRDFLKLKATNIKKFLRVFLMIFSFFPLPLVKFVFASYRALQKHIAGQKILKFFIKF